MTPLPFSGLSLLVHLGIISVSWALRTAGFGTNKGALKFSESWFFLKRLLSVFVLGSICTLMTLFIVIAITTGVHEGATEWHRVMFGKAITQIKIHGSEFYPEFLQYSVIYESVKAAEIR